MTKLFMTLAPLLLLLMMASACVVRSGPRYGRGRGSSSKACPPAHHWNGYACVHNGNGRGNGNGKGKGKWK